ncbi:hypothetical protein AVEN_124972-1 [Araneus ventricosus]|uniref:Uncharacterized protein n=1 Tax=Araneus ventricosus TaxID=182803 RepID=A0A4Y2T1H5_ARAVE|nr:hypothetical protein AVEN_124972-1 [Araneus ventricosus]
MFNVTIRLVLNGSVPSLGSLYPIKTPKYPVFRKRATLDDNFKQEDAKNQPAGVFSPKLSRILPQKDAVSPSPAWLKKFEPIVTQNPMTIRRFFIRVIEKYLGKE